VLRCTVEYVVIDRCLSVPVLGQSRELNGVPRSRISGAYFLAVARGKFVFRRFEAVCLVTKQRQFLTGCSAKLISPAPVWQGRLRLNAASTTKRLYLHLQLMSSVFCDYITVFCTFKVNAT